MQCVAFCLKMIETAKLILGLVILIGIALVLHYRDRENQ